MIEELLLRFSRENFGDAKYVPLLHGHSETAKPLSLIIKQKRSIWKRPFAKNEIIILDGLENFVSSDCEIEYLEAVKLNVIEQVLEKGKNAPVNSHMEIDLVIADFGEIKVTADDNLGDLQLGRVRQEYILDPDLRGILSWAVLDADKMIVYKDRELFLMTSVIYSEKFEVVGKRMQEVCTLSFSIFASSDSFQLKWLSTSRVSGELAFSDFSFSLVFSGKQKPVSNPHRSSQRF